MSGRIAWAGFCVFLACLFGLVAAPGPVAGEQPKTVIVNPIPLPVTGHVKVTGSADVNVLNVPSVKANQSGAWSVSVDGTPSVTVANTPDHPIPVQEVASVAVQPFQMICDVLAGPGNVAGQRTCTPQLPAGKRFIIEFLTARTLFVGTPSRALVTMFVGNGQINVQYGIPLGVLAGPTGGPIPGEYWESAMPVKLYAASTPAVNVSKLATVDGEGTAAGYVTLSGHLLDAQ